MSVYPDLPTSYRRASSTRLEPLDWIPTVYRRRVCSTGGGPEKASADAAIRHFPGVEPIALASEARTNAEDLNSYNIIDH